MILPGHLPSSRPLVRADGGAGGPPGGAVSEAQRRTIRKLAEALGVDPADLVGANKQESLVRTF
jgi:hypothetical protein